MPDLFARLLVEKHYPAAWVVGWPTLKVGTVVPIVVATNIPQDSPVAIRYWINTPELRDDAYGIGLVDGEFELAERGNDVS